MVTQGEGHVCVVSTGSTHAGRRSSLQGFQTHEEAILRGHLGGNIEQLFDSKSRHIADLSINEAVSNHSFRPRKSLERGLLDRKLQVMCFAGLL